MRESEKLKEEGKTIWEEIIMSISKNEVEDEERDFEMIFSGRCLKGIFSLFFVKSAKNKS